MNTNTKYVIQIDSDIHDKVIIRVFRKNKSELLKIITGEEAQLLCKILEGEKCNGKKKAK